MRRRREIHACSVCELGEGGGGGGVGGGGVWGRSVCLNLLLLALKSDVSFSVSQVCFVPRFFLFFLQLCDNLITSRDAKRMISGIPHGSISFSIHTYIIL